MIKINFTESQAEQTAWAADIMPAAAAALGEYGEFTEEEVRKIKVDEKTGEAMFPENKALLEDLGHRLVVQLPSIVRQTPDAPSGHIRAARNAWDKIREKSDFDLPKTPSS